MTIRGKGSFSNRSSSVYITSVDSGVVFIISQPLGAPDYPYELIPGNGFGNIPPESGNFHRNLVVLRSVTISVWYKGLWYEERLVIIISLSEDATTYRIAVFHLTAASGQSISHTPFVKAPYPPPNDNGEIAIYSTDERVETSLKRNREVTTIHALSYARIYGTTKATSIDSSGEILKIIYSSVNTIVMNRVIVMYGNIVEYISFMAYAIIYNGTNEEQALSSESTVDSNNYGGEDLPNNNYCTNPIFRLGDVVVDVTTVKFAVFTLLDNCFHPELKSCVDVGSDIILVEHGTMFRISNLDLSSVVLVPSEAVVNYAIILTIAGRLVFNEFNPKWALRRNYVTLMDMLLCSKYSTFVTGIDLLNSRLGVMLKY